MAKLSIIYEYNGGTSEFHHCTKEPVGDIVKRISNILRDGCAICPSDTVSLGLESCRTVYVIPLHRIIRFVVELDEGEECPDPHD